MSPRKLMAGRIIMVKSGLLMKRMIQGILWVTAIFMLSVGNVCAQGRNLAGLLTSTPWCSFKYNKITGYSKTTRYQFFKDGTYSTGGRSEGYSSGSGGAPSAASATTDQEETGSSGAMPSIIPQVVHNRGR